jgi:hypothetical protein
MTVTIHKRLAMGTALVAGCVFLAGIPQESQAYIEAPHSLGQVVALSTNIVLLRVEKVDKEKNLIIFKKVEDVKGKHPTDVIRHNIGKAGFHPREWQYSIEWAEPGKSALFFHNGGASETYTGTYWYQTYAGGDWWNMSHGEPFLLRTYAAGSPEKLMAAVKEIMAGKEVIVPCMVDGSKDDLHLRKAKIQRLKASLKLGDYNQKRDFVGWGGEDFRRINGLPGFTHYSALPRVDPEAQAISTVDFDGDGKADLCLIGGSRAVLLQNGGDSFSESSLPGVGGCRAGVWADYDGSGRPSLLLATTSGPKLFTNLGKNTFRDDSHLLPHEPAYNLTAAAWIDYDGDGRPDILLANGFHGLRLYRNKGPVAPGSRPLELGEWYFCGPFSNAGMRGFDTVYPPEKEINLSKKYPGKGVEATWKKGQFRDGEINNLALFDAERNVDAVVYVYREILSQAAQELPVSLGSDDTMTVWLNGEKLHAENVYRACAPDQAQLTLKLKPGKNQFLMKICQGQGEWAFYFASKKAVPPAVTWEFEDVSKQVGLGLDGLGSDVKGDTLTVCDIDGDGRPDFLYGAGTGMLFLNTPKGFVLSKDSGLSYRPGKVGPVFGDFDNSGTPSLFVPQLDGKCKLFKNDGKGHFTDVTAKAGDLAKPMGMATCAAWGDVSNNGHLDLVVGCLRGPNRYFRNKGDGTFVDATEEIGLHQKIFNTQGICLVDLNNRGVLDMIFANEGQESCVLLGNPERLAGKRPAVTLTVGGNSGVTGSVVRVIDKDGKPMGSQFVSGGDGRGGQRSPQARFALAPGNYKVEVRYSNGTTRTKDITVAATPMRTVIDEK